MPITPYTPTPFASAVANPAVGGTGVPYPYVSPSQYQNAPTAIDTSSLVPGSAGANLQSLADVLARASGWADRICFGADPAAKGASLCATLSVESAQVPVIRGELRLPCDYKPIVQLNGLDVGPDMSSLSSVGASIAARVRFGRRTIYVPLAGLPFRAGDTSSLQWPPNYYPLGGQKVTAVWSYVNGYPHTYLTASVTAGTNTATVATTDGVGGLLGLMANTSQLTFVDGPRTERLTVQSVTNNVITFATNFQYAHTAPSLPDFLPVTSIPRDVEEAVILLGNCLIKTQGEPAIVLAEMDEPKSIDKDMGDSFDDYTRACLMLKPFSVRLKAKN